MNINLNLATRPYLELRSVYARLRVAAVLLAVFALPMLLVLHTAQAKARLAEARVNQLETNIALLRRQQANARALALDGPNSNVIAQADFLNDLFRRKSFSWTASMSDLESTLPPGVQVQAIDPVVSPDGRVTIRMRVTGTRQRAVEVVHNLERSRYFVAPRLAAEALANQNGGARTQTVSAPGASPGAPEDVSFDILADYRQLPNTHANAATPVRSLPFVSTAVVAQASVAPPQTASAQLTNPARPVAPPDPDENPHPARPYGRPLPAIPPPIGGNR